MKSAISKYLYEFILLFAAVTASFWVENYRENKNEQESMKKQFEKLLNEFKLVNDSMRSIEYDLYFVDFNKICSLIRNDDNYVLNDSTFGFIAAQRFLLKSDFLDDLYKASTITERQEYRHVQNDTLASFFFRLNDYELENSRLMDWSFEYEKEITQILQDYDLHTKFYTPSIPDSLFQVIVPYLSGIKSSEEELARWRAFTHDPRFEAVVGRLQSLHLNAYFLHEETMNDFHSSSPMIEAEIEGY